METEKKAGSQDAQAGSGAASCSAKTWTALMLAIGVVLVCSVASWPWGIISGMAGATAALTAIRIRRSPNDKLTDAGPKTPGLA